jgi:hypothetical protein
MRRSAISINLFERKNFYICFAFMIGNHNRGGLKEIEICGANYLRDVENVPTCTNVCQYSTLLHNYY